MTDYAEFFEKEDVGRSRKERPRYVVLHQDERVVVFNKAPGVASIRERYVVGVSLKEMAEEKLGQLWTVHRIDKDTSGVIIFARDAEAHKMLNDQFERHETLKLYAAVLEGEMAQDEMTIDIPIVPDPGRPGMMRPSARGKESLTVLRVRERFRGFTYVEAEPRTGRQHQIRVHCRAVGLPLAVDPMYGNRSEFMLSSIKRKFRDYDREERPLMARLTLHAESLEVDHPDGSGRVRYSAPLPKDLHALLTQLRKTRAL